MILKQLLVYELALPPQRLMIRALRSFMNGDVIFQDS